jgi:hypothetical protein
MIVPGNLIRPALPGNAFDAIQITAAIIKRLRMRHRIKPRSQPSGGDGASAFVTDPAGSSQDQAIFWAPEVLPTIIPIAQSTAVSDGIAFSLAEWSAGEMRQAPDGWHVVLRISDVDHRLWLREPPVAGLAYAAQLPFDVDFEIRARTRTSFESGAQVRDATVALQRTYIPTLPS